MTRRIVLALSHSIEEHDQLLLLNELGYEAASLGGYIDPAHPHDEKRPALPQVPMVPAIKEAVDAQGKPDNIGAAQAWLPDAVLEWADTIVYHHYLDRLYSQWPRVKDWLNGSPERRVIWRTVGQSVEGNEATAQHFRSEGLEIVRYSPRERNIPQYAGEDALIRFYKDPDEWCGWTGEEPVVINITQHLKQRDPYTNWRFWELATKDLPRMPLGPGSEEIGGPGAVSYAEMKGWLRKARCYLYTGTQPASYTLGLIEAMMTGIPVVSIGPKWMNIFPYGPDLFEGHEIAGAGMGDLDNPEWACRSLRRCLDDIELAREESEYSRQRAIELFGKQAIGEQWRAFLG